jgi:cell division protein FtsL
MSIDVEYAIKKDVRNNPVVRGVDVQQQHEFLRNLAIGTAVVAMLLFSAWQQSQLIDYGYKVQGVLAKRAAVERRNRQLRLELEMLRGPKVIEARAMKELGMVYPTPEYTLVIERVASSNTPTTIVASAR